METAITHAPQSKDPSEQNLNTNQSKTPEQNPLRNRSEHLSRRMPCAKAEPNPQKKQNPHENQNQKSSSAFTLIELLVVIAIIAILAALAVPALTSALAKAQMNGTMNNVRQLYLAQFQMANDGAATGATNLAWPGELPAADRVDLQTYLNAVLRAGYLRGADVGKLISAPGANPTVNVVVGPPDTVALAGANSAAVKVHGCIDADPSHTIFAASHNYVYDTALLTPSVPYGKRALS